jgi:cation transporter-like permease
MKNRLAQSAFYSFLVTLYGTCIYYAIGVLLTLSQGGDVVKFFLDTLVAGGVLFVFLWFVFYELTGAFERLNKRDPEDRSRDKKDDRGDRS